MRFNSEKAGLSDNKSARFTGVTTSVLCKTKSGSELFNRFLSHVSMSDNCWLWTGTKLSTGYGVIGFGGKNIRVHRLAYFWAKGDIPANLDVLHRCDTPLCVNPDHLFLGTDADNHRDKAAKGRHWQQKKTHCPQGHAYTPENTFLPPSGGRKCVQCRKERAATRRAS